MNISIDHDKVIKKLMAGEKLSDVAYAKAHYEPTKEEIKKEKDRIIANRK